MLDIIAMAVWWAFALGYLGILLLTERTAGRYVRGETPASDPRTFTVLAGVSGVSEPVIAARTAPPAGEVRHLAA